MGGSGRGAGGAGWRNGVGHMGRGSWRSLAASHFAQERCAWVCMHAPLASDPPSALLSTLAVRCRWVAAPQVSGMPIDLGAMLLVGTTGNPLVALCEQVKVPSATLPPTRHDYHEAVPSCARHPISRPLTHAYGRNAQVGCRLHQLERGNCPLYDGPNTLDTSLDERAEAKFNALMTAAAAKRCATHRRRIALPFPHPRRLSLLILPPHPSPRSLPRRLAIPCTPSYHTRRAAADAGSGPPGPCDTNSLLRRTCTGRFATVKTPR